MYEALTGQPPFVHDSAIKVLLMQLSEPPQPLSVMVPDVDIPMELETIIMRCLEKDPAARYQNAAELGADLWTFAATGQRGIIPDPVAEGSEAPLAKEAAAAGNMLNKLDNTQKPAQVPPPPIHSVSAAPAHAKVTVPPPPPLPVMAPPPMPASIESKLNQWKKSITLRFKRFRSPFEMEVLWEGLSMARTMQKKDVSVTIMLDLESVCLALKPDVVTARFNLEPPMVKKLNNMQALLQALIKDGATVTASERWAKKGNENLQHLMPGVHVAGEEEFADLIIERNGSILEY